MLSYTTILAQFAVLNTNVRNGTLIETTNVNQYVNKQIQGAKV